TMPKISVLRVFVLNHIIHHRGQMSVYLRLTDTPVPSIYGPSADEGSL
ncbi:MAG: DinB family protein, partial [Acidobacteriota bacterium]